MRSKKLKTLLSLTLVIMMLVTSIYLPDNTVMASGRWADANTRLPVGVDWKNDQGFRVNLELYEDLKIIVYGDYTSVPNNDFKTVDGGYYEGGSGEYRYHGFTFLGEAYTNEHFPVDQAMTHPMDYYRYLLIEEWGGKSKYNGTASGGLWIPIDEQIAAQKGIEEILKKAKFSSGIVPNNASHSTSVNAWDYANVQTYPSKYTKGAVQLRHKRTDLSRYSKYYNSEWYLNLETNPIDVYKILPKEGEITASLTGSLDFKTVKPDKDYNIELTVGGELDDIIAKGLDEPCIVSNKLI